MKGQYIESLSSYKTQCYLVDKINITVFNRTNFVTDGFIKFYDSDTESYQVEVKGGSYYCGDTTDGKKVFLFTPKCKNIPLGII